MNKFHLFLTIAILTILSSGSALGEVPHSINMQGYLADDLGPVTGVYEATFRIYDAPENGNILWSETDSVDVDNGLYSQIMGESNPINITWEGDRWIGVQFAGHPEMTPRYRQTTLPYSFIAEYSDSSGAVSDNSITTEKIADGSVEPGDLSFEPLVRPLTPGITADEIADDAVTTAKISNGTIMPEDLSFTPVARPLTPEVSTDEIADNAVTSDKILNGAITGVKILDGTIELNDLGQNGASDGQVMKWDDASSSWISANDESGGSGWNWADSSSHGPDSVLFADNSIHSDSTDAIADGAVDFADISQNGASDGQVMKWNDVSNSWITANDESGGAGWNWSDSSSHGPDSVLFADNSIHSINSDSTDAITDGAVDLADLGQNGAADGQVMKWNIASNTWVVASDETGGGGSGGGWVDDGGYVRLETDTDRVGIGVATPYEKLEVEGSIKSSRSLIVGWNNNTGLYSSVAGGINNSTSSQYSIIGGGDGNTVQGNYGVIAGGWRNHVTAVTGAIGGGYGDTVQSQYGGIASGYKNRVGDANNTYYASFIGGGYQNTVISNYGVIAGGTNNTVRANFASILGGVGNTITQTGTYSYLFGFGSTLTQDSTFMVDLPNIRFGDESTGYEFPTLDGVSGQVMATDGEGQLSWIEMGGGGSGGGWIDDGAAVRLEAIGDSVGIGTATPLEKLDVDGNVLISGKATIGTNHTNTGYLSTIAGGVNNAVNNYSYAATISGGINNAANANYSVVSGGANNTASTGNSVVSGGNGNTASGETTAIGGGSGNRASGHNSAISGGTNNNSSGHTSYIGGGQSNTASNIYSSIAGGYSNIASGLHAYVGGGESNTADGTCATVSGGRLNTAEDSSSTVGGGRYNRAIGKYSVVAGGGGGDMEASGNSVGGNNSIIGGGIANTVNGNYSSILGGKNNTIYPYADYSYLFGINAGMTQDSTFMVDIPHIRFGNEMTGYEFPNLDGVSGQVMATDGAGNLDWVDMSSGGSGTGWVDDGTAIRLETSTDNVGIGIANPTAKLDVYGDLVVRSKANIGHQNTNSGSETFVAGYQNAASGLNSSVAGGFQNAANSTRSFIGSGSQNIVSGSYSAILGGGYNRAMADYSTIGSGRYDSVFAVGGGVLSGMRNSAGNEEADTAAFVGGGTYNSVSARYGTIVGGTGNIVSGRYGTIAGGQSNSVLGYYGTIGGGSENIVGNDGNGTVGGGAGNEALGSGSMIPGGGNNSANGITSFAAGLNAKALHDGSFVWADFGPNDYSSTAINQMSIRARGGVRIADGYNNSIIELDPTARRITIKNTSGNPVVEIGEGLDYAEIFSTSTENLDPGTVMIIDPDNPGQLTMSRSPYDKKVSGIIAGANGLGTGVKLGRKTEKGDEAIALAGRVYCNVDASYGKIEPGDLLTTSPTPGYAMVVKDHSRAPGSILGKAMESLGEGEKGKILVLVTLQ